MSFANFRESIRYSIIKSLSKGLALDIEEKIREIERLQSAFDYRKTDYIYLIQQGFNYDQEEDEFEKIENINYGKYPGKYHITVKIPDNYPNVPPIIRFDPLHNKAVSEHISYDDQKNGHEGVVCVGKISDGRPNSYWNTTMNVKGALMLSYQVVTNELEKPKYKKSHGQIPIKGTIFWDLSKIMTTKDFTKKYGLKGIEKDYSWEEIAYVAAKLTTPEKKEIIKFYNQQKNKEKKK